MQPIFSPNAAVFSREDNNRFGTFSEPRAVSGQPPMRAFTQRSVHAPRCKKMTKLEQKWNEIDAKTRKLKNARKSNLNDKNQKIQILDEFEKCENR